VILSRLFELVNPRMYYSKVLGQLPTTEDLQGNILITCPFHPDTAASLHINVRDSGGLYKCFGCGAQGNFIQFHQRLHDIQSAEKAALEIAALFGIDEASLGVEYLKEEDIEEAHARLLKNPQYLNHLAKVRGVTLDTVKTFKLGLEQRSGRVTIPIRDSEGRVVNVRRWLPEFKRATDFDVTMKCIGTKGFNNPELFPLQALREQEILICEGEMDCLMLISNGFNAITCTHGAKVFKRLWARYFRDKDVILVMDNDGIGREGSNERRELLYPFVRSIKEVFLVPELDDQDMTDYWKEDPAAFAIRLRTAIDTTAPWLRQLSGHLTEVNLHQAARHDLIGQQIKLRAVVAGREDTPMAIPAKVQVTCDSPKKGCPGCPALVGSGTEIKTIQPSDPLFIELITSPQTRHEAILCKAFQIGCKTPNFEVLEYYNVEEVRLIPDLDMSEMTVEYTIRTAYIIGYGVAFNEMYELIGTTSIDPRNNLITHIFWSSQRINRVSESLNATDEVECDGVVAPVEIHLQLFQPGKNESVTSKLRHIWHDLETNVTRIVRRTDVLRACDLTMHSPLSFTFDGEAVIKGWLDCLIIGDTNCGKSKTVERYLKHFRGGEVYSGENISKVGIIGGYINMSGNGRPRFVLGVWPLNDTRAVWLDEASGMTRDLLSELTMLRDHGVAESTKQGQRNRFPARVRFGLISNPRPRESGSSNAMNSFAFGVLAVRDLIGADADIARFDMAVCAANAEVSIDDIHRGNTETAHIYTSDLCNLLLRWAWSRKTSQIKFEASAVRRAKELAKDMSEIFDPSIPLVTGQSQRLKIARLATAIAIRLFSSPDGENVVVTKEHIEEAHHILVEDFSKPSMGYHAYSASKRRENSLPNPEGVKVLLDQQDYMLFECLISNRIVSKRTVEDVTGLSPGTVATIFRELIRLRCIAQRGQNYALTPAFIRYLADYAHPHAHDYYSDERQESIVEGL